LLVDQFMADFTVRGGETFLLVGRKDVGCSYWLTKAGRVLQHERCEKFLMVMSGFVRLQCDEEETFLLVSRKDAGCPHWLAGKMRDVPIG
jgi:hypothetical protein